MTVYMCMFSFYFVVIAYLKYLHLYLPTRIQLEEVFLQRALTAAARVFFLNFSFVVVSVGERRILL